jgi:tetratricopeptide (TPR) repeat protein
MVEPRNGERMEGQLPDSLSKGITFSFRKSNATASRQVNQMQAMVQKWADGKATLQEVRGYTDEQLYAVARVGYLFFNQGKITEARTIFQGLFAINPRDAYLARAVAVVEFAAGNDKGALAVYDLAIKLAPKDPAGYLGRAEVFLSMKLLRQAVRDLNLAVKTDGDPRQIKKARSLLRSVT